MIEVYNLSSIKMAHILGEDYSQAVSSFFRFIFSLVIFVVYTATAVIVTKRVKYKFTFKIYANICGFIISMGINLIYGILTLNYQDKLIKYIHIPQTVEEFVLICTFYSLLYEMRIVYLKIISDDHSKYRERKRI
jgi:hypothetical protein